MADKVVFQLPKPMPASNDCLPHAAMNLGAPRGLGLKPVAGGMVTRLGLAMLTLFSRQAARETASNFIRGGLRPVAHGR